MDAARFEASPLVGCPTFSRRALTTDAPRRWQGSD